MSRIFIIGSINMDLVRKTPYMPVAGETMHGNGFMTNPGGKGANQAVAVSKLGGNAYMVGAVGKEFGEELISTLNGYGVNVDYVAKEKDVSSGIAVIIVENGENRIILDAGANAKVNFEMVDKVLAVANKGDYLICQLEIPNNTVEYAMQKAKEKDMITVLNPAPAKKISERTLSNCDYFIVNQTETEFFTGIYPEDEKTSLQAAEILKEKGINNVIITLGSKGSCAVVNEKYIKIDGQKVNVVDTTAAGDTYVGALVVSLAEGNGIERAMEFASKASALTVTKSGAQQSIPYLNEIS